MLFIKNDRDRQNDERKREEDSPNKPFFCIIENRKIRRMDMARKFTEEQLKKLDKEVLIQFLLNSQEQLESVNQKLQLVLKQLAISKKSFWTFF